MSYKQTNSIAAERLIKLSEFIKTHMPSDRFIMVDFYEEQVKRHIDVYALVYYVDDERGFSFSTEEVNACLVLLDGDGLENTSDLEKQAFEKEHGFYKFNWFYPD